MPLVDITSPPLEIAQGIGNPDLDIMTAWQASIGAETNLTGGWHIDSSFFGGWMDNLVVRDLEVDTYNDGDTVTTELQPYYLGVDGLAMGWEGLFRIRPSDTPWWGWVSVTISKALRRDVEGNLFPSDYDMPLAFTAVGAYTSVKVGKFLDVYKQHRKIFTHSMAYTCQESCTLQQRGEPNSDRYPAFFRLDLRVQKVWSKNGSTGCSTWMSTIPPIGPIVHSNI